MKKFLIYGLVLVAVLFVGFTTYYFVRNNETIELKIEDGSELYINKGSEIALPIEHAHANKNTVLKVTISDRLVVSYDEAKKTFSALSGGMSNVIVTPSNENFKPMTFSILVGNGKTAETPYYLSSVEQIQSIGKNDIFGINDCYRLVTDLDLSAINSWAPIGDESTPFGGRFDGFGHTITNLKITSGLNSPLNVGFFGVLSSTARVEYLNFKNPNIVGSFGNAGVVAGINKGIIGLCQITDAKLQSPTGYIGGVCGTMTYDKKRPQVNMCEVSASFGGWGTFGGLVGINKAGAIANSTTHILGGENANGLEPFYNATFGGLVGENQVLDGKRCVVEKSYTIIDLINGTGKFGALFGKSNHTEEINAIYAQGLIYCTSDAKITTAIAEGNDTANVFKKSLSELSEKKTYIEASEKWNFKTVWKIYDATSDNTMEQGVAKIDFTGSYEPLSVFDSAEPITNNETLLAAFDSMREMPESDITYIVENKLTIDMKGAIWEPIGSREKPFNGSLVAKNGIIIENVVISSKEFSGLFGFIGGDNSQITNVTVKNARFAADINLSSYVGVLVGYSEYATLSNISIEHATLLGGKNAGLVAGYNGGTILNAKINENEASEQSVIKTNEEGVNIGGLVGDNKGNIADSKIYTTTIGLSSSSINAGGLVGTNRGKISTSSVLMINMEGSVVGVAYVGGLSGVNSGNIENSYASSLGISIGVINEGNYVGGLVGSMNTDTSRIYRSFAKGSLEGYNAAGLAAQNFGTVDMCYAEDVTAKGKFTGGFAVDTHGKFTNSYVNRVSLDADKISAGFTCNIYKGASIEFSYNACTFAGKGEQYAETATQFRQFNSTVGNKQIINNSIVVFPKAQVDENGNAIKTKAPHIQSWIFGIQIKPFTGNFIHVTYDECVGLSGDFACFKEKAGFDYNVWQYFTEATPTLVGMPIDELIPVEEAV